MSPVDQKTREEYAKHIKEYYDKQSAVYSATYTGDGRYPTGHHRLQVTLAMIDQLAKKPNVVLDAGCGDGRMVAELVKKGYNCKGFDVSDGMIEVGKRILKDNGLAEDLIWVGDIYKMPAEDHSVDLLLALGVLENLDDHEALFNEFRRVLAPGGRVIFSVDNQLFSLFSFNKHTVKFYKSFFDSYDVPQDAQEEVLRELASWLKVDDVQTIDRIIGDHQIKKNHIDIPQYNRLSCDPELRKFGWATERLRFYHVHPLPPRFESKYPELFRGFAEKLETSDYDWRSSLFCNCMLVQAHIE